MLNSLLQKLIGKPQLLRTVPRRWRPAEKGYVAEGDGVIAELEELSS
jgi:hypothetical protein